MCSILGGTEFTSPYAREVFYKAKSRGRDLTGLVQVGEHWVCNHRATPTNEVEFADANQPFGKAGNYFVHNGTIANDEELGNEPGAIDSQVIAKVVGVDTFEQFANDVQKLKGSFAIAVLTKHGDIYLACNYKPIFIARHGNAYYFSSLAEHLGEAHAKRVKPYTCLNLLTGQVIEMPRQQHNRALVVCSGGLDSTAITGYVAKQHNQMAILHFDYGCLAASPERLAVERIAEYYQCELIVKPLDYTGMKGTSPLFGTGETVSKGKEGVEYAKEWVCARNLIMLSHAVGIAEANGYGYIYLGNNLEEAGAYPDNEEQFVLDFNSILWGAVNEGVKIEVRMPVGHLMKKEIVAFGTQHNSPLHLSWSCYKGGKAHCGECAPCFMRQKAFTRAGITDPTVYEKVML